MQLIEKMRTKKYTEISLQSIFFFGIHSSLFRYDNITSSSYPYQHFFSLPTSGSVVVNREDFLTFI